VNVGGAEEWVICDVSVSHCAVGVGLDYAFAVMTHDVVLTLTYNHKLTAKTTVNNSRNNFNWDEATIVSRGIHCASWT